ncbi:MAG: TetR/AcrR family transcriptional regulator [Clostridia bacterium]|nr:TetR/AcrR family transcriptional regulator [Clostridia bacterium]
MPPRKKITREDILSSALLLIREKGADALNARELAKTLGTSTQPIFSQFASMKEVQNAAVSAAWEHYLAYRREDMTSGRYSPYKASGMSYIRFAGEEKELFKLLFMRDRREETYTANEADDMATLVADMMAYPLDTARRFHFAMWIFVHGIATMIATDYLTLSEETVSALITDTFRGLKRQYDTEEPI